MTRPSLAVWKLASCDGCQLALLDCEDELLTLPGVVSIAHFLEASSAVQPGPYDISLVEGSVTTARDAQRIREIREQSHVLVTIGACATAGGIQALRNFGDVAEFTAAVYASPEYIDTLATSTPVAAHVPVDFELRGCPIDRRQLLEVLTSFLVSPDDSDGRVLACRKLGTKAHAQGKASTWPKARALLRGSWPELTGHRPPSPHSAGPSGRPSSPGPRWTP